jgi:hypothetical protein
MKKTFTIFLTGLIVVLTATSLLAERRIIRSSRDRFQATGSIFMGDEGSAYYGSSRTLDRRFSGYPYRGYTEPVCRGSAVYIPHDTFSRPVVRSGRVSVSVRGYYGSPDGYDTCGSPQYTSVRSNRIYVAPQSGSWRYPFHRPHDRYSGDRCR